MAFVHKSEEIVELFLLQLNDSDLKEIVASGEETHCVFSEFNGYHKTEYLFLGATSLAILIHWKNDGSFEEFLPQLMCAAPVRKWFTLAHCISHQPAINTTYDRVA